MRQSTRKGDTNQTRCCCVVALKWAPSRNRRLRTETPLSPGALPTAKVVGKHPSPCVKLNPATPIITLAHVDFAETHRRFWEANPWRRVREMAAIDRFRKVRPAAPLRRSRLRSRFTKQELQL